MGGTVAIVGRPNVGKSALFNRIVGRRIAIVHDQPGVTRDRISAEAEWRGASFTLVDTGGIGLRPGEKSQDAIQQATAAQADLAVASSDLILLVTDAKSGPAPLDEEIAARLRQSGKPVVVAMNKADTPARDEAAIDF
ncbi:MAG: 50S ribosome-binding GTPase, partial [Verrucomicrobia bacterium]|nr:50S ribosome-binding GTPase [Verrucomicrobiota bacterium]